MTTPPTPEDLSRAEQPQPGGVTVLRSGMELALPGGGGIKGDLATPLGAAIFAVGSTCLVALIGTACAKTLGATGWAAAAAVVLPVSLTAISLFWIAVTLPRRVTARCRCTPPRKFQITSAVLTSGPIVCRTCQAPFGPAP